ncbi:hypothetical protein P22_0730 [Propionispora sp. 2/2-37]|uniref:sirohydrochlorin cobaltochelatase n=1 Tax=Propionispora sp. 2/2-37 TaxID=1677858 RepID=UPI0006C212F6|nr:sirohydrochlorin cobaltochelatase [Propionispora sp. 2/2-37]CUH94664.1 hypothetical protein P22_0730 [Propionispora sp. 2/2-37]
MADHRINDKAEKKAILVISFGTTYPEALKVSIEAIEQRIKEVFATYEVRRAFTSRTVIRILSKRDGFNIDNEREALLRLQKDGYSEVYIQPLHVVPGAEYDKINQLVSEYTRMDCPVFKKIALGRPLLANTGQGETRDDYLTAIAAACKQVPDLEEKEAVVFMGHGGQHPANAAYALLQRKFEEAGYNHIFVYTVEGAPSLQRVMAKLKEKSFSKVLLMPFMLLAGDHALNDMTGPDEDSAQSQLTAAGFQVRSYVHGLGENTFIQDLYIQHLQDAIAAFAGHNVVKNTN